MNTIRFAFICLFVALLIAIGVGVYRIKAVSSVDEQRASEQIAETAAGH